MTEAIRLELIQITHRVQAEPPYIAAQQAYGLATSNASGLPLGEFALESSDPPPCTVGFLPPSQWRSPQDQTDVDTPDGLYCKLPQDSPIAVRGARNYPCMGQPGKRAPTVEICESDKPYEPLAMRQHALGPYPIDPSLLAQGIPPDDRITFREHIFGPLEGTAGPPPGGDTAIEHAAGGPAIGPAAGATPAEAPTPPSPDTPPLVTPSGFHSGAGPSVAIATYDPKTGQFATPDGGVARQTDVVAPVGERSWTDLLPTG